MGRLWACDGEDNDNNLDGDDGGRRNGKKILTIVGGTTNTQQYGHGWEWTALGVPVAVEIGRGAKAEVEDVLVRFQ